MAIQFIFSSFHFPRKIKDLSYHSSKINLFWVFTPFWCLPRFSCLQTDWIVYLDHRVSTFKIRHHDCLKYRWKCSLKGPISWFICSFEIDTRTKVVWIHQNTTGNKKRLLETYERNWKQTSYLKNSKMLETKPLLQRAYFEAIFRDWKHIFFNNSKLSLIFLNQNNCFDIEYIFPRKTWSWKVSWKKLEIGNF